MALLMGISDVGSIPVCDNRLAFLNDGVKRFSSLYESEMTFIADFISTLVWLIPKMQMPIMEVLHFTNFHMLPLFPMPHSSLFHRSISFQENSGFLVSSKTSITKHFIIKYTRSTHFMAINTVRSSGESLIDFLNGKIELSVIPKLSMLVTFTGKLLDIVAK